MQRQWKIRNTWRNISDCSSTLQVKNTLKISIIHMPFPMKFSEAKQAQSFEKFAAQGEVLLAICLQHEIDHLNGKPVTDLPFRHISASFMRRNIIRNGVACITVFFVSASFMRRDIIRNGLACITVFFVTTTFLLSNDHHHPNFRCMIMNYWWILLKQKWFM